MTKQLQMHDTAVYISVDLTGYVSEQFPDLWTGHSGPQNWPLWSLDLNSPYISVYGFTLYI